MGGYLSRRIARLEITGVTYNQATEVFDWESFRQACMTWMTRHNNCSWQALYLMAGIRCPRTDNRHNASKFANGYGPPSLLVACRLASVCDISIDKYIIHANV